MTKKRHFCNPVKRPEQHSCELNIGTLCTDVWNDCDCPAIEERFLALEATLLSGWLRGCRGCLPQLWWTLFMDSKVAGAASLCYRQLLKRDSMTPAEYSESIFLHPICSSSLLANKAWGISNQPSVCNNLLSVTEWYVQLNSIKCWCCI